MSVNYTVPKNVKNAHYIEAVLILANYESVHNHNFNSPSRLPPALGHTPGILRLFLPGGGGGRQFDELSLLAGRAFKHYS